MFKTTTLKKFHKWPGLILAFILIYYSITGIFMNHREFFSNIDVNRKYLPVQFGYTNWNNSSVKSNLILSKDSTLVFGNIGIWLTDSTFNKYQSFNAGFPKGIDNRKVFDVHKTQNGDIFAATQFGLFGYNKTSKQWESFNLNIDIKRFVALESKGDTIIALNRSYVFKGKSEGLKTQFEKIELKTPEGFQQKVSLFETIWQIHSGEILGIPGKLFVDFIGLVIIFLSLSGIIYFFFPGWIKRIKANGSNINYISKIYLWSNKWHNKLGEWLFSFLILLFFTGMFLRPPLLIAIAKYSVPPIVFSQLDQPNPWYDKLRDLIFDAEKDQFLVATSEGIYHLNNFNQQPQPFYSQPPVSVMGINSFEKYDTDTYLVGSFSGLFLWNPNYTDVFDLSTGNVYENNSGGRPIGDIKVAGVLIDNHGNRYLAEYDKGMQPLFHESVFPEMPEDIIDNSPMSLWNLSLEIHTGRIFQFLLSDFYILIVPLSGLVAIIVTLSGYLIYKNRLNHKRKNKKQV
jgi:hypothetical protein